MAIAIVLVGGFFSTVSAIVALLLGFGLAAAVMTYFYVFFALALTMACIRYANTRLRQAFITARDNGLETTHAKAGT